jgi:hypothetical protein
MKRQNSGQIRIIEAFLAALIIFSAFAVSSNLSIRPNVNKSEDLVSIGVQALGKLDSDGSLSRCIDSGNWTALCGALNIVLPSGVCFNLTVYDDQMRQVNTAVISNGGFNSQQITFIQYICASQSMIFHCYIIYLHMAVTA